MPTEVGVSLALRRQNSLLNCQQEASKSQRSIDGRKRQRPQRFSTTTCSDDDDVDDNGGALAPDKKSSRSSSRSSISCRHSSPSKTKRKKSFTKRSLLREHPSSRPSSSMSSSSSSSSPTPVYSSWLVLRDGAMLYVSCMVLPTVVRVVARSTYNARRHVCTLPWFWFSNMQWCQRQLATSNNDGRSRTTSIMSMMPHSADTSAVLAPDAGLSDVAIVVGLSLFMALVRIALVHFLVPNYNQPKRLEALVRCKSMHLLSSSYPGSVTPTRHSTLAAKNLDTASLLSGLHLPDLPNLDNDGDDAEDAEDDDGNGKEKEEKQGEDDNRVLSLLRPNMSSNRPPFHTRQPRMLSLNGSLRRQMDHDWLLHQVDDSDRWEDDEREGHNDNNMDDDDDDDDGDNQIQAPAVQSGLLTRSSAQNLQALLEQAAPQSGRMLRRKSGGGGGGSTAPGDNRGGETMDDVRVFAAPKYATAAFRLMFCSVSCLVGLMYFVDANFWPPVLGGSGSTKNCWDLSSVGASVMDSDFDQHNTVLRRYYLLQASYHFHSAAFHILASILLWFVSKSSRNRPQRELDQDRSQWRLFGFSAASGMITLYSLQSFVQHCFSIALIMVTYLFSSTRRLGAIAMFSFDASSLFLHFLQLGINAPSRPGMPSRAGDDDRTISARTLRLLHWFLVIPSFCFARFYIFPFVVAYSALEESQDWLRQLDFLLVHGVAKSIHGFFVVAFLVFLFINIVYFLRLLNHPHVMQILQTHRKGGKKLEQ